MDAPRPLTVLEVVEPGVDGVFRYVEALTKFLRQQPDVRVHLAYSSVRGSLALDELAASMAAEGSQVIDLRVNNSPSPRDVPAFLKLRKLARAVKPDIIHAHSSKAGVLARALALTGISAQYFYTPHAYYLMHGPPSLKGRLFQAIERAFGGIGQTIHCSPSEAAYGRRHLRLAPQKQFILFAGVDCDKFRPPADPAAKREIRRRLGLPEDALILGTIARYSEQKDPLTLYRALLIAFEKLPSLYFAHVGQGELARAVAALLQEHPLARRRIWAAPRVGDPAEFYRALDGFVLPSRYEGFSLAALEAAATNLPLILTRCPGNVDLDGHGFERLIWVPVGDAPSLAASIVGWAGHVAAGASIACNLRAVIREKFEFQFCYRRLLGRYQLAGEYVRQNNAGSSRTR